jgi:hypothetical protein
VLLIPFLVTISLPLPVFTSSHTSVSSPLSIAPCIFFSSGDDYGAVRKGSGATGRDRDADKRVRTDAQTALHFSAPAPRPKGHSNAAVRAHSHPIPPPPPFLLNSSLSTVAFALHFDSSQTILLMHAVSLLLPLPRSRISSAFPPCPNRPSSRAPLPHSPRPSAPTPFLPHP